MKENVLSVSKIVRMHNAMFSMFVILALLIGCGDSSIDNPTIYEGNKTKKKEKVVSSSTSKLKDFLDVNWSKEDKYKNKKKIKTNEQRYLECYFLRISHEDEGVFLRLGFRNISNKTIGACKMNLYFKDLGMRFKDGGETKTIPPRLCGEYQLNISGLEANSYASVSNRLRITVETKNLLERHLDRADLYLEIDSIDIVELETFEFIEKVYLNTSSKREFMEDIKVK